MNGLLTALLGDVCEDSGDDEDEVEEMRIVQDLLESVCALESRLCEHAHEVEARLDEAEPAEHHQSAGRCVRVCDEN